MRKRIFTVMAALCSVAVLNAADVNVNAGDNLATKIGEAGSSGVVRVAVGTYVLGAELTIPAGVTVIGGYPTGDFTDANRIYPGATTDKSEMTIFDGNSLLKTTVSAKHRVAKVSGTLEGVVIRNGHVRTGNGGGVLVENGGTVQNCIIKGNVAMNVVTGDAVGGGAYLAGADAKLINCVVAFNMANNGYGVAGSGQVINNTITANTYAPVAVEITGATYKHFKHWRVTGTLPWNPDETDSNDGDDSNDPFDAAKHLDPQEIEVNDFRLAQTSTTTSQYAVFAAAMDLDVAVDGSNRDVYLKNTQFSELTDPVTSEKVTVRMGFSNGATTAADFLFRENSSQGLKPLGIDYIYASSVHANSPMNNVTWFGALAYSVWIGGTLPTEGQWELAARSNGTTTLETYLYAGSDILNNVAWHSGQGAALKEVALLEKNKANLYDMTGNVWEWCADWINSTSTATTGVYYPDYTDSGNHHKSTTDPLWSKSGSDRVNRGGSYSNANGALALAFRYHNTPTGVGNGVGFRPVLVP